MFKNFKPYAYNRYANDFLINFEPSRYVFYEDLESSLQQEIDETILKQYSVAIAIFRGQLNIQSPEQSTDINLVIGIVFDLVFCRMGNWTDEELPFHIKKKVLIKTLTDCFEKISRLISQKQIKLDKSEIEQKIIEIIEDCFKKYLFDYYGPINEKTNEPIYDNISLAILKNATLLSKKYILNAIKECLTLIQSKYNKTLLIIAIISTIISILVLAMLCSQSGADIPFLKYSLRLQTFIIIILIYISHELKKTENKINTYLKNENNKELYERLGVDLLCIQFSKELLSFCNPDKENEAIPAIADLRMIITDKTGFVFDSVRILDNNSLKDEIKIQVRNQDILTTTFYDKKYVIKETDAKNNKINLPPTAIYVKSDNIESVYWVDKKEIKKEEMHLFLSPTKYFKEILYKVIISNIDKLFSISNTQNILALLDGETDKVYIFELTEKLTITETTEVFSNILKEGGCIKDITFVIRKILIHLRETNDLKYIAYLVAKDLNFDEK